MPVGFPSCFKMSLANLERSGSLGSRNLAEGCVGRVEVEAVGR